MFQHYTHEQMVEITLVVALANFTNRFNNGLEILP
jgi:alkylhydroperoxidase family enzyme